MKWTESVSIPIVVGPVQDVKQPFQSLPFLLEKNELTAGSTWHAAGNCPSFSASWAVMNMQRYSLDLYRGLAEAVDYPLNYHVTGSVRLAHGRERMREFERVAGMGRYQGMDLRICTPQELTEYHPFMETHDLAGGLWDPMDGDIDPAQLTQALAKGARDGGQTIAQDRDSSVIYGMPRAAAESRFVDQVLPLDEIAPALIRLIEQS